MKSKIKNILKKIFLEENQQRITNNFYYVSQVPEGKLNPRIKKIKRKQK